ncbi:uncharacterized protein Tco025E_01780 [Trypanosoma conorhini]|uniref:Uncharacterized protein n=1 Tax=Trypanosoma conorhini TaxID=83891 RepID=A0A3R7NYT3_9TRYP|nr:uncharacterized protein Tco025E_01780 [Trypanosoma conorhini]RNF25993.1 hypothetical protein Tco025E_01780 [Trypanosoma conorhini]
MTPNIRRRDFLAFFGLIVCTPSMSAAKGAVARKFGQSDGFLFLVFCVSRSAALGVCCGGFFSESVCRMAEHGTAEILHTFFHSRDENVGAFLCSFLELSAAERALLVLGESQQRERGSAAPQSHADAEMFTAIVQALRAEAQNEKERNAAVGSSLEDVGATMQPCATLTRVDDVELEEVELEESTALKTSAITAFLNYGFLGLVPDVDNFFGGEAEGGSPAAKPPLLEETATPWPVEATGPGETMPAEGEKREKLLLSLEETAPAAGELGAGPEVLDAAGGADDDDDGSWGDIELPGLAVSPTPQEFSPDAPRCNVVLSAADLDVLRDGDCEVRPFVMDPCFDYDADPVGKAARTHPRLRE